MFTKQFVKNFTKFSLNYSWVTEIVQLYFKDMYATMVRPVQELVGFARVELAPGEEKKVTFTVDPSIIAFLDGSMRWKIEKGEVKALLGSSSTDIRLEESFRITENKYIEGCKRSFYSIGR